jgi:3',5'-cyclic AMP phosphodiesterase CpdA
MVNWNPYLESICHKYAQWWQVYTLTDVEGRQRVETERSPLLLGLMVQTVQPEKEEVSQKQEKTERLGVLEGLRKYAKDHVLLVGHPGSGKSTALARLLLEEAQAHLEINFQADSESRLKTAQSPAISPFQRASAMSQGINSLADSRIPVLVELRYYQTSVLDLIRSFFKQHGLLLDKAAIERLLFEQRFLLLVDGLNELPSEAARQDLIVFRRENAATPMIFTTRDLGVGGNLDIAKKLTMQPLTEAQMQQFVRKYLPEHSEQMLQLLGAHLQIQEFGQTPLLLVMLCSLFELTGRLPSDLGLVFRQFIQSYDYTIKVDVPVSSESRRWGFQLLKRLAFAMTQGYNLTESRETLSRQEAEELLTAFLHAKNLNKHRERAHFWLVDLLNHHLIELGVNDQIKFRHSLIREYYAAEALLELLPNISDDSLKRDYLNYPKWTEVLALMLNFVDQESQALRVVKAALEVDFILGARLAGAVKSEFQTQAIELFTGLNISPKLKLRLLGIARSDSAIISLIEALINNNFDIRKHAANELKRISGPELLPYLSELLLTNTANHALDEVLDLIAAIQQRYKYYNHVLHYNYTLMPVELGRINIKATLPTLHPALAAPDRSIPQKNAHALERVSSSELLPYGANAEIQKYSKDITKAYSQHIIIVESSVTRDTLMEPKLTLRVVVASPSDVKPERNLLSAVIEELNHGIAAERGLRLELSRWETDAYPGFHPEGAQGLIDSILRIEDCDILIGIFWKRFGTPVTDAESGTEHEFRRAYESWRMQRHPQIMFYFCERSYTPRSKEEVDQWGKVLHFKQTFPREGLSWTYKSRPEFERLVRIHLTKLIRQNWGNRNNLQTYELPGISPKQSISTSLMHILHLSDLHFGNLDNAQLWYTQLAADLRHELKCTHLDAVILSGDIANKSTPEEYDAAKLFLDKLITAFQPTSDQLVIVPGNHDLNWGLAKQAYILMDRQDYQGELQEGCYIPVGDDVIRARDENNYKQRFANFSKFYQDIKGESYPLEYEQQGILHHLPEHNLLILGLNSAWQLDHYYKSRASIHSIALSNALEKIDTHYTTYEKCLKIAVWHHPLDSAFPDRIIDQGFMEQLAVAGFRLFLHGHIHKAETSLFRYDLSTNGRKLDRICAGTFGAPTKELVTAYPWQYNLLKFEGNKLTVHTRRREELNGAWKPDARWLMGAGQNPLPYYEIPLFAA